MMNHNEPQVVLVDVHDMPVGSETKSRAHQSPHLHRAFSVFLYNGSRMLIQQRAAGKYHSSGLWANSCCSHPRPGETLHKAVRERMNEEIGVSPEVEEIFDFVYFCRFSDTLFEYEFDHVFLGVLDGEPTPNPEEAQAVRWVELDTLEQELVTRPEQFSVWFLTAAPRVIAEIRKRGTVQA